MGRGLTSDKKALVVSEASLEAMQYHGTGEDNTWTDSTVREWLNHDFVNAHFTNEERNLICETELSTGYGYDDKTCTYSGEERTWDKVFILDYETFARLADTKRIGVSEYLREKWEAIAADDVYKTVKRVESRATGEEYDLCEGYIICWMRCAADEGGVFTYGICPEKENHLIHVSEDIYGTVCPAMYINLDEYKDFIS